MTRPELLREMLEVNKQIYITNSWKRRNDLKKYLRRLESEWYRRGKERG